jgi:hypothetical protein
VCLYSISTIGAEGVNLEKKSFFWSFCCSGHRYSRKYSIFRIYISSLYSLEEMYLQRGPIYVCMVLQKMIISTTFLTLYVLKLIKASCLQWQIFRYSAIYSFQTKFRNICYVHTVYSVKQTKQIVKLMGAKHRE